MRGRMIAGAALIAVGLVWIGQGLGVLSGSSFMVGDATLGGRRRGGRGRGGRRGDQRGAGARGRTPEPGSPGRLGLAGRARRSRGERAAAAGGRVRHAAARRSRPRHRQVAEAGVAIRPGRLVEQRAQPRAVRRSGAARRRRSGACAGPSSAPRSGARGRTGARRVSRASHRCRRPGCRASSSWASCRAVLASGQRSAATGYHRRSTMEVTA